MTLSTLAGVGVVDEQKVIDAKSGVTVDTPQDPLNPALLKIYQQMGGPAAERMRDIADRVRGGLERQRNAVIEVGQALIEAKAMAPRGTFGRWAELEFNIKPRLAQLYMNAARRFGGDDAKHVSRMPVGVTLLLAAPSTPEPVRQEAIAKAKAGDLVSFGQARKRVATERKRRAHWNAATLGQRIEYSAEARHQAEANGEDPDQAGAKAHDEAQRRFVAIDLGDPTAAAVEISGRLGAEAALHFLNEITLAIAPGQPTAIPTAAAIVVALGAAAALRLADQIRDAAGIARAADQITVTDF